MTKSLSVFRSPEGEAQYAAAYDAALAKWPVPYEERYITTRFGDTHVVVSGPPDAPPLILLHGMSFAAVSWTPSAGYFSRRHRVYAPDSLNDLGKSRLNRPITGGADFAAWLVDLFAGLQIDRPCVVGHSYGGWLALCLDLHQPGHMRKLALISPAATFFPYPLSFMITGIGISFFPSRPRIRNLVRWMCADGFEVSDQDVELFYVGLKNFRPPRSILARTFKDDELRRIQTPTMLIIGEQEVIYNPRKAIERAERWMPNVTSRIVKQAGHGSIIERPEEVSRLILDFFEQPPD